MLKRISKKKWLAVIYLMTFFTLSFAWSQNTIDMSEVLLKIQDPVILYDLGDKGFAVNDVGEAKLKILNWEFKLINQFPLKRGEGPGEIKNFVSSACFVDDKIFLLGFFGQKIKVFNRNGIFEKEIPLDFTPKDLFFKNGKLYLLNLSINASEESFSLGRIIDPLSGKKIKDISLKNKLVTPKTLGGNPILIGMSSTFDVGKDGNIYILVSSANLLISVNTNNQLEYKIDLPYKERKTIQTEKKGEEENIVLSVLDWYTDMRAYDDGVYVCFQKTVKKDDKTGEKTYQTVVLKLLKTGKFSEKIFAGNCVIIGRYKGYLHLFNSEEYKIIPVKLNEW